VQQALRSKIFYWQLCAKLFFAFSCPLAKILLAFRGASMRGIIFLSLLMVIFASCGRDLEYTPPARSTLDYGATSKQAYFGMSPSFQFSKDVISPTKDAVQPTDAGQEGISTFDL
jgi:hypothetical protein